NGNTPGTVQFSGLTPQFPGVYQINAVVPPIPAGNAVPLQVQIGGITSPPSAFIAVSQ
ncbi:MAG TPA: hypothetical protein DEQ47_00685, partial [Solibacterales bacterium]|nr:hypothetical protein [Bryobacterales bacterium]